MFKSTDCACNRMTHRAGFDDMPIVPAGEAAVSTVCGIIMPYDSVIQAQLYMNDQKYTEGLCPDQALESGTMFPELIG